MEAIYVVGPPAAGKSTLVEKLHSEIDQVEKNAKRGLFSRRYDIRAYDTDIFGYRGPQPADGYADWIVSPMLFDFFAQSGWRFVLAAGTAANRDELIVRARQCGFDTYLLLPELADFKKNAQARYEEYPQEWADYADASIVEIIHKEHADWALAQNLPALDFTQVFEMAVRRIKALNSSQPSGELS